MSYVKEIHKYEGFKLLSLDLRGNSLMGKSNLYYNFVDENDKQDIIYTTVIIGANGTGKSNLFRIIIELLKELNDLSRGKSRSYNVDGNFNLKFSVNGDIFEYANIVSEGESNENSNEPEKGNTAFLLRNGKKIDFELAQFPLAIVANSIMLTDKFPFFRKEKNEDGEQVEAFPRYKYLGVRNIPQSASTRAYVRRTVEFIVEQFEKKDSNKSGFISALKRATDFLELDNSIDIYYYTSNNAKFFRGDLTPEGLDAYFEPIREKYPKPEDNPPFKLNQYLKIKEDRKLLQSICDFCNKLVNEEKLEKLTYKYSSIRKITYNLIEPKLFERLNAEYPMLEHLRQLGIISSPEIQLKRAGGYSLQESSSGEYHFFSSIVGLMATVKPTNSLVLIDEPEISLHPNWQMKYLSFLRELFSHSEYATCHILVATHSHFLISDLKGDSSKIIGLKRAGREIEIIDMPKGIDTYGWSAEDVLYNVFNVLSTRNKFVAEDIAKILNELSSGDKNKINKLSKEKYDELLELESALKDNDPLKRVVKTILTKVSK
ncbi:AAA family ATPase [Flavobacterium filum]|uniref:AAA family ATPase n=1 Tax=Flavobacterium filum TaxID=370974 RepID=UPI0023F4079F|nr:AAA family ATPase [Flavobacterium filum]